MSAPDTSEDHGETGFERGLNLGWIRVFSVLVILCAAIAGLVAVQPLFAPGYVMNFDHTMQQGIIACFQKDPSVFLAATWCSHLQAGIAPFQSYPVLFYQLVILISSAVGLELAYKIALMIVWFLLPSILAFLFWRRGHPLAGAFAFALTLLFHGAQDATGLEFFLIVGSGFNQALGFSLFALTFHLAINFFESPTRRRLAFLSISTALYFLAHPTTFILYLPVLIVMIVHYLTQVKAHLRLVILYPILVGLLSSFFLVPVLINAQSNEVTGVGLGVHSPLGFAYSVLIKGFNPLLLLAGVLGLLVTATIWKRDVWAIPALSLGIAASWFLYPLIAWVHVFDFAQFDRTVGLMLHCVLVGAAFFGEAAVIWSMEFGVRKRLSRIPACFIVVVVAALFLALIVSEYRFTSQRLQEVVTASHPLFAQSIELMRGFKSSSGRILFEETYGQTLYPSNISSVWGIAPIFTPVDTINPILRFFRYPYGGSKDGRVGQYQVVKESRSSVRDMLEGWNIAAVVAGSPLYNQTFDFLQVGASFYPFTIFFNNETPLRYFHIVDGSINDSEYQGSRGWANVTATKDAGLLFKVRYWGNWVATVDGQPIPIVRSDQDFMAVGVPKGSHMVRFRFVARWWDHAGLILTIAGLVLLVWIGAPRVRLKI